MVRRGDWNTLYAYLFRTSVIPRFPPDISVMTHILQNLTAIRANQIWLSVTNANERTYELKKKALF